jgi:hypothetical protein
LSPPPWEFDLLLRFLERVDQLLVLALGVAELLAQHVIAAASGVVFREQPLEAAAEFGGVAAEEAQGVLQLLDGITGRAGIAIRLVARSRTRRGDASHHVADETLPARATGVVEFAHRRAPSTFCGSTSKR